MVIQPTDRVSSVLRRDERLVDVFVAAAPALERLRNPVMRRTMARLVTVEQAARIAGVDAVALVERLNRALGDDDAGGAVADRSAARAAAPAPADGTVGQAWDAADSACDPADDGCIGDLLRALPGRGVVDVDVRDDLRAGREPFSRIMAARRALRPGEVLRVRAIFEPVPLYDVMARQGLDHRAERLADDDWRVWFFEPGCDDAAGDPVAAAADAPVPAAAAEGEPVDDGVVVLDVRGLEPPEPMLRTLAALDRLPAGGTLVQLNVRVPQFLLPQLDERGLDWEIREQSSDLVRLLIRRPADATPPNPA